MSETNKTSTRKRTNPVISENLDHGKLPPQSVELEEAVLGALMLEKQSLFQVKNILHPKVFYKESHQKIFQAIIDLSDKNEPVDILTVTTELKRKGELDAIGGPYYISQLTNKVSSAANIEFHSMIVFQNFMKREHIRLGSEMVTNGYDDTVDVTETNEMISKMAHELLTALEPNEEKSNVDLIREVTKSIEEAKIKKGITGQETGFTKLDEVTCGWQNGDLIYIAARPSMGKTAFVLTMAKNMAFNFKQEGAFFSLEMTAEKLMKRMISDETDIPLKRLQKGELDANDWIDYGKKVAGLTSDKLHIIDKVKNIYSIKSKLLELHAAGKLKWAIIDYLQLIDHPQFKKNREREISEISRTLKLLALELNIPIICLSQLSREVEKRTTKRPQLSDLRDSGSIEQDADIVMFLFRGAYYKMKNCADNLALGLIAKNRNGELKKIKFDFHGPTVTFKDWVEEAFDPNNPSPNDDLPF